MKTSDKKKKKKKLRKRNSVILVLMLLHSLRRQFFAISHRKEIIFRRTNTRDSQKDIFECRKCASITSISARCAMIPLQQGSYYPSPECKCTYCAVFVIRVCGAKSGRRKHILTIIRVFVVIVTFAIAIVLNDFLCNETLFLCSFSHENAKYPQAINGNSEAFHGLHEVSYVMKNQRRKICFV